MLWSEYFQFSLVYLKRKGAIGWEGDNKHDQYSLSDRANIRWTAAIMFKTCLVQIPKTELKSPNEVLFETLSLFTCLFVCAVVYSLSPDHLWHWAPQPGTFVWFLFMNKPCTKIINSKLSKARLLFLLWVWDMSGRLVLIMELSRKVGLFWILH